MRGAVSALLGLMGALGRFSAWCGGALLLAAAGLVTVEVLARKLFAFSIGGADELSSYALAVASAWGFGFALLGRAHIRIDVLYERLRPARQRWLDALALAAHIGVAGLLVGYGWQVLATSLRRESLANTPLQTPLWIPQSLWLAGLVFFLLVALLLLLRLALALAHNPNDPEAAALVGISSIDDELAQARQAAGTDSAA